MSHRFAAVDLGAASGRVVVGTFTGDGLDLAVVHRFPNEPVRAGGTLYWDILALYRGVLDGLARAGPVDSIGIDSWAVDYGLLDVSGALLGNPVHYRDARTDGIAARVPDLYAVNGLQTLPFNTVYQLLAAADTPQYATAATLLMIPDLMAYWLTGEIGAEYTNASTTGLLDVRTGRWATSLIADLGLRADLLPPIRRPGDVIGRFRGIPVVAVGSHDTASAVVAVPACGGDVAYVSSGTWSLVGLELDRPVLSAASRTANFTNEGGVDRTIRYLRNVAGLWPLQECMRGWGAPEITGLLTAAAAEPLLGAVVDLDDPIFLPPGDMAGRIRRAAGLSNDASPARITRCILDSLALAQRRAVRQAAELAGVTPGVLHLVGGGARNELLCRLTADATGLPVLAGPVEATALGNLLVQARAAGVVSGGLDAMRALVRQTQQIVRYEPRGDDGPWRAAAERVRG
ncbi:carbohydrate kinase [Actinoplanes sp. SE50]|uniref:rhamnulokinase n=1 Tax=unclassified Actinoplanes TaxID=2626549 RepID=UPI00023ECC6B|nr:MULTISPECIES: rhamnulokinase family protein [unclassified Actinoplanes]AEV83209.1 rhamnulokinase [Actinoplanes sp. SE50/110]ATO81604.1 carbohydrate kinase [Actinoplanes sp. SE50]SLL99012.1 carbohydrate kinase [Actinoplanes sp. SE50/110]